MKIIFRIFLLLLAIMIAFICLDYLSIGNLYETAVAVFIYQIACIPINKEYETLWAFLFKKKAKEKDDILPNPTGDWRKHTSGKDCWCSPSYCKKKKAFIHRSSHPSYEGAV